MGTPNGKQANKETKEPNGAHDDELPAYSPTPYTGSAGTSSRSHHTNAIIEAGLVRARDEVRIAGDQFMCWCWANIIWPIARDAEPPTKGSASKPHLQ
jgi:hypothetical protein